MDMGETKDGASSSGTAADARERERLKYEPPAVAWEETFDPVAQTLSDCQRDPLLQGC